MKLEKLQKVLRDEDLDGCILYPCDANFRYYLQEYLMKGLLFIPATGKPTVFVHPLEDLEHEFNVVSMEDGSIEDFFEDSDVERVGYNAEVTTAKQLYKLRNRFHVKDVSSEMERVRMVKTEQEINYLKEAAKMADEIMQELIDNFDFETEKEIRTFLKTEMAKRGVEQSFEPVVACGREAAVPHYFGSKELEEGFLIVDMGVQVEGYCSDITRTFYLGEPSEKERELYEKVLAVQEACVEMCTAGKKCKHVYKHARQRLGEKFNHGLGHGIGLRIHELPDLKESSDDVFLDNMVFTVEPGWYDVDEEIGIRIEDDVWIEYGEPQVLTETTKELQTFPIN